MKANYVLRPQLEDKGKCTAVKKMAQSVVIGLAATGEFILFPSMSLLCEYSEDSVVTDLVDELWDVDPMEVKEMIRAGFFRNWNPDCTGLENGGYGAVHCLVMDPPMIGLCTPKQ